MHMRGKMCETRLNIQIYGEGMGEKGSDDTEGSSHRLEFNTGLYQSSVFVAT